MKILTQVRWILRMVRQSRRYRGLLTLLIVSSLALASAMVVGLDLIIAAADRRMVSDLTRYGATLVVRPRAQPIALSPADPLSPEPAARSFLDEEAVVAALSKLGVDGGAGRRLRLPLPVQADQGATSTRQCRETSVPVEGMDRSALAAGRRSWHLRGQWPGKDEAIAGRRLAAALSLSPGSSIRVRGSGGTLSLRIAAVIDSGDSDDGRLFVPLAALRRTTGLAGRLSRVDLAIRPSRLEAVQRDLARLLPEAEIRRVEQIVSGTAAVTRIVRRLLLAATSGVLLAALLGVVAAFGLERLDRTREMAVLKALGASAPHLLAILFMEAAALAVTGWLPGLLAGWGIALAGEVATGIDIRMTPRALLLGFAASLTVVFTAIAFLLPSVARNLHVTGMKAR